MTWKCCVKECSSFSNVKSYKVPAKPLCAAEKWFRCIGRSDFTGVSNIDLIKYRICEHHFTSDAFKPYGEKRILKYNAFPSLKLPTKLSANDNFSLWKITLPLKKVLSCSSEATVATSRSNDEALNNELCQMLQLNDENRMEQITNNSVIATPRQKFLHDPVLMDRFNCLKQKTKDYQKKLNAANRTIKVLQRRMMKSQLKKENKWDKFVDKMTENQAAFLT